MKTILRVFVYLIILLALVIGALWTSPVQTFVANYAGKAFVDPEFSVDSVSVGLNGVEIQKLNVRKDNIRTQVESFQAETSLLALLGGNIRIKNLTGSGIVINVNETDSAKKEEAKQDTAASKTEDSLQEFFKPFTTPLVRIEKINISGRINLPKDKSASFSVLSDPSKSIEGVGLTFHVVYTDITPKAALASAEINGSLTALQNSNQQWDSIAHEGTIFLQSGTVLKQANTLNTKADIRYKNDLLQSITASIIPEKFQLSLLDIEGKPSGKKINVLANFNLQSSSLESWMDTSKLPAFNLKGTGAAEVDLASLDIDAKTSGNISVSNLSRVNALFASLGSIQSQWNAQFVFHAKQTILDANVIRFDLTESKTNAEISLTNAQSFSVELKDTPKPVFSKSGEVAKLTANNISPALLGAMLPPSVSWKNMSINAVINAGENNDYSANADALMESFSVRQGNQQITQPLNIQTKLLVKNNGNDITADLNIPITETATGTNLCTTAINAQAVLGKEKPDWKTADIHLASSFAGLQRLPVLSQYMKPANGNIDLKITAENKKNLPFSLSLSIADLTSTGQKIGTLSGNANGTISEDNTVKIHAVGGLQTNLRKSEFTKDAELQWLNGSWKMHVKVLSKEVFADDFLALKEALIKDQSSQQQSSTGSGPKTEPSSTPQPPDEIPIFLNGDGSISISINTIHFKELDIRDATFVVAFQKGSMLVEQCTLAADKMKLDATGALRFVYQNRQSPYAFTGKFNVKDADLNTLMHKIGNDSLKVLNGTFNANGSFTSDASALDQLLPQMQGDFSVSSLNGTLYPLIGSSITEKGSKVINILEKVREATGSKKTVMEQVYDYFQEIPYDKLSLKIERDASLNIGIPDITVAQKDMLLQGSGTIFYNAIDLGESRVNVNLGINAKGYPAELLQKIGLVAKDTAITDSQFVSGPNVAIGGSLDKLDFSDFSKTLTNALNNYSKETPTIAPKAEETPRQDTKPTVQDALKALDSLINKDKKPQ